MRMLGVEVTTDVILRRYGCHACNNETIYNIGRYYLTNKPDCPNCKSKSDVYFITTERIEED